MFFPVQKNIQLNGIKNSSGLWGIHDSIMKRIFSAIGRSLSAIWIEYLLELNK